MRRTLRRLIAGWRLLLAGGLLGLGTSFVTYGLARFSEAVAWIFLGWFLAVAGVLIELDPPRSRR